MCPGFFFAVDNAEVCHSWSSLCNLMMMTLASLINDTSRQVLSVSAFIAIWKQQCLICQLTYWWWLFVTCKKVHSSTRMKKNLSFSFNGKLNTKSPGDLHRNQHESTQMRTLKIFCKVLVLRTCEWIDVSFPPPI